MSARGELPGRGGCLFSGLFRSVLFHVLFGGFGRGTGRLEGDGPGGVLCGECSGGGCQCQAGTKKASGEAQGGDA